MRPRFSREFFTANRRRLSKLFIGTAPIVVTANGLLQRGADSSYPFAQDASFWYLTGINEPDVVLVIDRGKEYLIVPKRSQSRETFDGAVENDELSSASGIDTVLDEEEGWKQLSSRLKKVKHVATLASPPAYVETYGFYVNPARLALTQKMKGIKEDIDLLDLSSHIVRLRMIKQPEEIAAIKDAIDLTGKALRVATTSSKLAKYNYEYELEAEITKTFKSHGQDHAFDPIVASGERACTLHNVSNSGKFHKEDLVVIDIGAEVEHYAADITRTIALSRASKRQTQIYDAVIEVQAFAFELLKPGILLSDYEQAVAHFMGEKLRELNLIKSISHESVRQFFPHATSHFLGLNVHDAGDHSRLLEPGMVLTVEPGIYVKREKIGIRIEDDILITDSGIEILSQHLPKKL